MVHQRAAGRTRAWLGQSPEIRSLIERRPPRLGNKGGQESMTTASYTTPRHPRKAATTGIIQFPQHDRAACLDRLADCELAVGRHSAAERLSHAAAELRAGE